MAWTSVSIYAQPRGRPTEKAKRGWWWETYETLIIKRDRAHLSIDLLDLSNLAAIRPLDNNYPIADGQAQAVGAAGPAAAGFDVLRHGGELGLDAGGADTAPVVVVGGGVAGGGQRAQRPFLAPHQPGRDALVPDLAGHLLDVLQALALFLAIAHSLRFRGAPGHLPLRLGGAAEEALHIRPPVV